MADEELQRLAREAEAHPTDEALARRYDPPHGMEGAGTEAFTRRARRLAVQDVSFAPDTGVGCGACDFKLAGGGVVEASRSA